MNRAPGGGFGALLRDYGQFAGARLWTALGVMLLASIAEGFGLLMIVPLASIAIGQDPAALSRFANWFAVLTPDQRFAAALALFVAAMSARSALIYARDLQSNALQARYEAWLRLRAASTLARRGWSFSSRIGQAGMQSLLLNDVPRSALAVHYAQQFVIAGVMLAVQLTLTAILSPTLTAVALAVLVLGGLFSVRWARRGVMSGIAISATAEDSTNSGLQAPRRAQGRACSRNRGAIPRGISPHARRRRGADRPFHARLFGIAAARRPRRGDHRRRAPIRRGADARACRSRC